MLNMTLTGSSRFVSVMPTLGASLHGNPRGKERRGKPHTGEQNQSLHPHQLKLGLHCVVLLVYFHNMDLGCPCCAAQGSLLQGGLLPWNPRSADTHTGREAHGDGLCHTAHVLPVFLHNLEFQHRSHTTKVM